MAERERVALIRLAAELRSEVERIERTVAELESARAVLASNPTNRLTLYGAAALLETYYTGVEKALARIARVMNGMPEGADWHRQLLEDARLALPSVRPTILSDAAYRALEPYLAFRHRFRNLYLFDLEVGLLLPLVERARATWTLTANELERFARAMESISAEV